MAVQFVPVVLRHEPPKAQQAKQNEGNLQESRVFLAVNFHFHNCVSKIIILHDI